MPTRTWKTVYDGHTVEVQNWWGFGLIFNRHHCQLFIDGKREDELSAKGIIFAGEGSLRTVLRGQIPTDGDKPAVIRAEVWSSLLRMKCHITADDVCILEDA